jgi:hypothetical protein
MKADFSDMFGVLASSRGGAHNLATLRIVLRIVVILGVFVFISILRNVILFCDDIPGNLALAQIG